MSEPLQAPAPQVSPVDPAGLLPDPAQTNLEAPVATERDTRGVGYVMSLIGLYLTFFVFFVAVAWFGIFSET